MKNSVLAAILAAKKDILPGNADLDAMAAETITGVAEGADRDLIPVLEKREENTDALDPKVVITVGAAVALNIKNNTDIEIDNKRKRKDIKRADIAPHQDHILDFPSNLHRHLSIL